MHRQLIQLKNQNGGTQLNPTNSNTEKSVTESYSKYRLSNNLTKIVIIIIEVRKVEIT